MRTALLSFLTAVLVMTSVSCGSKRSDTDTAPFATAIGDYLREHSMGMKVHEFKELAIEGQSAKATVSLGHAEEATAIKVRWEFEFTQNGDRWIVSKCTQ